MQSFPAFFPLEGRRVAVIGEGPMADAKARLFEGSPASVVRLEATPPSLAGFALVFVALPEDAARAEAVAIARRDGVPVNVVDGPALSDFYTPAIVDRGELVIGVSTSGAAPTLARDLRARIEAIVPAAYAQLAAFARRIRARVLARRTDFEGRRRAWEAILRGAAGERALAGDQEAAEALAARTLDGETAAAGVVHLVGAGPGDPELLTLKALRTLQDADIVFHDKLVDSRVLDLIRRDAERVFVGKARGDHAVPQREIEARMIAEARKGRRVVRLKGGDPFVFGRGGEELQALRAAGVEAHVVPGITAALGCAAEAGVPLTHRDHAQAVTFVTGHAKEGAPDLDWPALANAKQTIVVYMGVDTAAHTARSLIAAGRDAATPVMVIESGATPHVKRARGVLSALPALIADAGILGPAILVIGDVVALADASAVSAEQAA
ncbi:MAG: uroporphyrinogen-III C-methyltransferase [Alphaproteobacteria bacterium]|nr:uroporphyrinogen-III C-methyltransferase [Alphaproteobacteria bacterium]